jgi:hypothetical protein
MSKAYNDRKIIEKSLRSNRESVYEYLRSQLIGPAAAVDELLPLSDKPYESYLMGAIFPVGAGVKIEEAAEDQGNTGSADDDDDPISLAYQMRPASLGLSFFTRADEITVGIYGAHYLKTDKGWKRQEFGSRAKPAEFVVTPKVRNIDSIRGVEGRLTSVWRKHGNGWLVTVVFANTKRAVEGRFNPEDVLYQTGIICSPKGGPIEAYPAPSRYSWDEEEEDLALIYRSKNTFAIGHGVAATWLEAVLGETKFVETTFLPRYEVPAVTAKLDEADPLSASDVFSLQYLADEKKPHSRKIELLKELRNSYVAWVAAQSEEAENYKNFGNAPSRLVERMRSAIKRIDKGINILSTDRDVLNCFLLANHAMHMQMVHSSEDYAKNPKDKGFGYSAPNYADSKWSAFRWRPFQLVFQILVIESLANRNSNERDIVDLIWFPTGGGKTEAYLAIAAFELFYRRVKYGDAGGGTSVIKRYTLRLLTAQQFERVSALICACEMIRRARSDALGDEPFTLGLWVGEPSTPNTYQQAHEKYSELVVQNKPENPYQLQKCPWCGTRIVPHERHADVAVWYGVRSDQTTFEFFCPEESCCFHEILPINVVDDHLYRYPPSFLVGTIDKFARMAWTEEPRAFFAGSANGGRLPPSLIIQDELHLISGPLGTIAGLYEAAMDVVMKSCDAKPKYVAATATIRRSAEQCRRLYSREVAIFPPSGLKAENSFFSREDLGNDATPGRLYVGVMGQYHSPVTSLVHTTAVLSQAPVELPLSDDARDGYWTQVIFHNSKRELGKTMTLCRDDIPKRAEVIASRLENLRKTFEPVEMSANIPSQDIPVVLTRLNEVYGSKGVVDMLPCTNMFSVGVDVGRLGLMVMNGQPKTTAEYIQASSRVGRSVVPGIVIAFYPNNKARDRSHYESFIPYHQALYRAVEPTSVTPYSTPAMERALHACLVIVMRYAGGLPREEDVERFNPSDPAQAKVIKMFRDRMKCAQADDEFLSEGIDVYLDACIGMWAEAARKARQGFNKLRFDSRRSANFESLLIQYRPGINWKPELPWATLNSMRNVDQECRVYVMGEPT